MRRYEWSHGGGREPSSLPRRGRVGYGREFGPAGTEMRYWRATAGDYGADYRLRSRAPVVHERGVYGEDYPSFGGYPGAEVRGEYYGYRGGRALGGYGVEYTPRFARGYDRQMAEETFLPESAYRRHPELAQQPHRHRPDVDRWGPAQEAEMSDREIRQAVRERLHQDAWLDVERIDLRVQDGVVTLTGEVDDFLQSRYAWDDAWETPGVRGVMNNLTVRTDLGNREQHGGAFVQSAGGRPTGRAGSVG